jgi:bacteriorhodopsin
VFSFRCEHHRHIKSEAITYQAVKAYIVLKWQGSYIVYTVGSQIMGRLEPHAPTSFYPEETSVFLSLVFISARGRLDSRA